MASLAGPTNPFLPPLNRRTETRNRHRLDPQPSNGNNGGNTLAVSERRLDLPKLKEVEARERKEETNRKIASQKAISIILRREATKAVIEKKKGNSKKLLPRTVLEALHERITALRWESALKTQLWLYIKLIVMLGKCKQPEKAHTLFQAMIDEGCVVDCEAYTALIKVHSLLSDMEIQGIKPNTITYNTLLDAYGKAKKFIEMESLLVQMLRQRECQPDVWTMNSSLRAFGGSGQIEMMEKCYEKFQRAGIEPNIKTFNVLLDSYGNRELRENELRNAIHAEIPLLLDARHVQYCHRCIRKSRRLTVHRYSDVMLDTVFYNCLVDSYGMMGCFAEMKGVIAMMKRSGCEPDKITYRTMIKAYTLSGMTSQAKELQNELASLRGFR
ncbi:Pentatricopeptide repeat-containing protein, chloroplastic [Sesamum angolense]|uniref:Pentatricopeptide repeat-containing protein, chloroplastic n=1 Tax=Sesamum angolense TaxID=2727404 RepID=A0AAE2C4Y1_9LAMI|nr:Pentatricopeptide repeat-containing protein, chloroplastic [Sesamum angolense]